jgi:hypothetical protein
MQKVLIAVLGAGTIALGVLCLVQSRRLAEAESRVNVAEQAHAAEVTARQTEAQRATELERDNIRLERQVQQFAQLTTGLRSNEAAQSSQLASLTKRMRPGAAGNSGNESTTPEAGANMSEMLGRMLKDPAMREMMREQQKAMINLMYGSLFKELNLTSEEQDALKNVLVESQMRNVEAAQGLLNNKDGSAAAAVKTAKDEADAKVKALLGEPRYAQYQEYQQTIGERMQLNQFRAQLGGENTSLSDQQFSQLLQAMKEERVALPPAISPEQAQIPQPETFSTEAIDRQLQWMQQYNERVLARAGQVLAPEQLKQFKSFQERQAAMQRMGLNMARSMFGTGKEKTPPAPQP